MTTIQETYTAHVEAVRALGNALRPAVAVRYEAPSRAAHFPGEGSAQGVKNPTLDTVLDPRRLALSEAVEKSRVALLKATRDIEEKTRALETAISRWEGLDRE